MVTSLLVLAIVSMMRERRTAADGQQIMVEHTSSLSSTSQPNQEEKVEHGDDALGSFVVSSTKVESGSLLIIDDLRAPSEAALSLEDALHTSISNLFYCEGAMQSIEENLEEEEDEVEESRVEEEGRITIATSSSRRESYQCFRLYSCIQAAVARAVDSRQVKTVGHTQS